MIFHITLPALLTNVVFVAGRRHHQMVSLIQIYLCPSLRPPGMRVTNGIHFSVDKNLALGLYVAFFSFSFVLLTSAYCIL